MLHCEKIQLFLLFWWIHCWWQHLSFSWWGRITVRKVWRSLKTYCTITEHCAYDAQLALRDDMEHVVRELKQKIRGSNFIDIFWTTVIFENQDDSHAKHSCNGWWTHATLRELRFTISQWSWFSKTLGLFNNSWIRSDHIIWQLAVENSPHDTKQGQPCLLIDIGAWAEWSSPRLDHSAHACWNLNSGDMAGWQQWNQMCFGLCITKHTVCHQGRNRMQ